MAHRALSMAELPSTLIWAVLSGWRVFMKTMLSSSTEALAASMKLDGQVSWPKQALLCGRDR